ncbi:MAG: hypothetical protein KDA87_27410, partial [Planctomycetales bacterium]|nr:hypothetical protein [Planctomycetales bacterium]
MSDKDGQSGGIVNGIVQYVQKRIPNTGLIITLSGLIGISAGFGATVFTLLIEFVSRWTVEPFMEHGVGLSYAV